MFSRTSSGIRNTPLFYSNSYLVIVEGTTDKPFWSRFFPEEVDGYKREIKDVGGRLEVQKYIDELSLSNAKFVVAIDSDYRLLLGNLYNHPRIVETLCHSIENLILCPYNITTLIRDLSHDVDYKSNKVDVWLEDFDKAVYSLMVADFLIEQNNISCQCAGDNCSPFLMKTSPPIFDNNKINKKIERLNVPQEKLEEMTEKLRERQPRFHIRGHFFFSAVLYFITSEVKRLRKKTVSISNDSFYAMSINSFEACCSSNSFLKTIQKQAVVAAKEVVSLLEEAEEA